MQPLWIHSKLTGVNMTPSWVLLGWSRYDSNDWSRSPLQTDSNAWSRFWLQRFKSGVTPKWLQVGINTDYFQTFLKPLTPTWSHFGVTIDSGLESLWSQYWIRLGVTLESIFTATWGYFAVNFDSNLESVWIQFWFQSLESLLFNLK